MRQIQLFPALLTATVLIGCATRDSLMRPELSIVDIRVADVTVFETAAEVTLRITNPEPEPLQIEGGVFRLTVDGLRIGKGLLADAVEIPQLESATVRVDFFINNLTAASRLRSVIEKRRFSYELDSLLYRASDGLSRRLRGRHGGLVDLEQQARPAPAE